MKRMLRKYKRLSLLLLLLFVVSAIFLAMNHLPEPAAERRIPRSTAVAASLLSATNGSAVVQLTNSTGAMFRVVSCRIHSRGSPNDPDGHISDEYRIGGFPYVAPGTSTSITRYVIPKGGSWRAEIIVANDVAFFPAFGTHFGARSAWTEWTKP